MKKYDAYKDSGVKWIGEIPNHWEAIKISRVHPIIGSGTTPLSSREDYYSERQLYINLHQLCKNTALYLHLV